MRILGNNEDVDWITYWLVGKSRVTFNDTKTNKFSDSCITFNGTCANCGYCVMLGKVQHSYVVLNNFKNAESQNESWIIVKVVLWYVPLWKSSVNRPKFTSLVYDSIELTLA